MRWLREIFRRAQEDRWCVRPNCTTCSSHEFWSAVWDRAVVAARLEGSIPSGFEQVRATSALLSELKETTLDEVSRNIDAVRTILIEMGPFLLTTTICVDTGEEVTVSSALLEGCAVGVELERMRVHSGRLAEERTRRFEYENLAPARAMAKQAEKAARFDERRTAKAVRQAARRSVLLELLRVPPDERLSWLVSTSKIPLAAVPAELISRSAFDALSTEEKHFVRSHLRKIKGWKQLFQAGK